MEDRPLTLFATETCVHGARMKLSKNLTRTPVIWRVGDYKRQRILWTTHERTSKITRRVLYGDLDVGFCHVRALR